MVGATERISADDELVGSDDEVSDEASGEEDGGSADTALLGCSDADATGRGSADDDVGSLETDDGSTDEAASDDVAGGASLYDAGGSEVTSGMDESAGSIDGALAETGG